MPKYVPKSAITKSEELSYGENVFGQLNRLSSLANDLHDRVLALSIASFAEECLGRLLRAYLLDVEASGELLEGFNSPIGTLSARLKLSHAMGLITDFQFHDLDLIRKIRNEFAHTWDECTFIDPKIQSWVAALHANRLPRSEGAKSTEQRFRDTGLTILVELEAMQGMMEKQSRRLLPIGIHLSTTPPATSHQERARG